MLKRILRSVGLEVLDEIGDEIEDLLFGRFKDMAFFASVVLLMLLVYFVLSGVHHTFN